MAMFFNLVGGKAEMVFVPGGIRQGVRFPVSARLEPGPHLQHWSCLHVNDHRMAAGTIKRTNAGSGQKPPDLE